MGASEHRGLLVAAPVLGFFGSGLLTPSHNSLAAIGLLLVAAGLVSTCGVVVPRFSAMAVLGVGGVVVFLEPSSALLVAAIVGAALLSSGKASRRVALGGAGVAVLGLLLASWWSTGTPLGLVERVLGAMPAARLRTHPHVEQRLRALGLQFLTGVPVLRAGERELVPVRAPNQASDVTPRRSAAPSSRTMVDPGSSVSCSSGSPRQSVNMIRSPDRVSSMHSSSSAK